MVGQVAGIALGVVFILAGGAKMASPTWPAQARELGAPAVVARLLPHVEVALGALLGVGVARPAAATVGFLLLLAFTTAIVVQLARGRRPPCACFGGRTPRPIGPLTVVRNVAFLALAAVAALA